MSETKTQTLADFVLARYDQQEAKANWLMSGRGHGPGQIELGRTMLVDVAAKRRIVELHRDGNHECSVYDHNGDVDGFHYVLDGHDCSTMQLLALPYADHPDYREEWRP